MQDVKLDRTLGLRSVVLFGLAHMTPMIVFGTFGPLATASQGTTAMSYLLASGIGLQIVGRRHADEDVLAIALGAEKLLAPPR
ncbi:hypothetical protein [Labrys neptuniae]|jgi:hypothetical protein